MSKALATKNVAAVLLAVAMVFGFAFSFAAPANAQSISDLQAQIQALLAQIQALQGGTSTGGSCVNFTFTTNFRQGQSGAEVMQIQKFLNASADTRVAATGAGSPGNETSYFGPATRAAVIKFQEKYAADILTPVGLTTGTGNWYASTRAKANALAAACVPGTPGTPGTPGVGGTVQVMAGTQPANSLAVEGASRVPFTTFTVTNTSAAAATINNVTVQKNGLGDKAVFDGIILVDAAGTAYGNAKTMNSNNQAILDAGITLQPGQSIQLTVAGNMLVGVNALDSYAGQILGLSVVGVSSNGTVTGSLPITGAMHTINASLNIGTMTFATGSNDPLTAASKEIGTTGFIFASVRATNGGSAEDQWVKSIRWNQSGSAASSDLANVVTVVDGVSYPTTVSSDGKYYTTVFPGMGLEIQKGLQKEFTVRGDIVNGPNRTIQFDIYKASDIFVVGETFGYGITPTASSPTTITTGSEFTSGTPFFSASVITVSAGTVSSVSRANEVPAQNVVELSPNQPLGGFAVDIKGEPISVASLTFGFDLSAGSATQIDNITLVDANGAVVAGPVDGTVGGGNDGKVTFTDTVTFPTGRTVYTLRGQLDSSFSTGDTIQATTTPNSTYWSNARGTITGNTITLGDTLVTGNTMTVRSGGVVLSIAPNPAAQTVVAGSTDRLVSSINFDASQSGEDVRFNSAKFLYAETLTGTDDITNCAAYDGATRLNSSSVNFEDNGQNPTFQFDTALVVAKGTVKTVQIRCDIPSSITGSSFNVGFDFDSFTGVGVTSNQTITPTSTTGANQTGNSQTVSAGGSLSVALDASSPAYKVAAAGTTGVTLGALRFSATDESMTIERVALQMSNGSASSSPANLTQVTLWDGATQVGTAIFAGTRFATSTLTSPVVIPANGSKTLTVKGDLAGIGTGQASTQSGLLIEVDYDGNDVGGTRAIGSSGPVNASGSDTDVAGVRVHRSIPTITYAATPGALSNGVNSLATVTIAADPKGDVQINKLTFSVATTSATLASPTFIGPNGSVGSVAFATGNTQVTVTFTDGSADSQIPAGGQKTYTLGGTVSGVTGSGAVVSIGLEADAAYPSLSGLMGTVANLSSSNTIWSPNSTTTPANTGSLDWTNGYGLGGCFATSGLGVDCFAVTKSN